MSSQHFLPKGSLFLISGANSFIGSHIADVLLEDGYRVRGTVRDVARSAWLQDRFDNQYGTGKFELVKVENISVEGAFDEALIGVDGFAHVASDLSFSPDPNIIVTPVVEAAKSAMASVLKAKGVKTYVLTSSSTAATKPYPNEKFHVDGESWNEVDVKAAWAPPPYERERAWAVYGASKAEGERESWNAYKGAGADIGLSFNTVLPNANFGPILDTAHQQGSTAAWIRSIFQGGFDRIKQIPPQHYIYVRDTAKLHAALLTDPSIRNQRVLAFAEPFDWDTVLQILRENKPRAAGYPDSLNDGRRDLSTVDNEPALGLLRTRYGQAQWTPLKQGVLDSVADL